MPYRAATRPSPCSAGAEAEVDPRRSQIRRAAGSLFASDVYQSYTASYTWSSNQAAHLGLGFCAAALALGLVPWLAEHRWILFVVYPLKEARDVVLAGRMAVSPFPVPRAQVLVDAATDLAFVTMGIALAAMLPLEPGEAILWLCVLAALAFLAWRRFGPEKRAFDKSALPYLFRLGAFRASWSVEEPAVRRFLRGEGPRHLLLVGKAGSGRTTLAVAIGCEMTVRQGYARYCSAGFLAEHIATGRTAPSEPVEPWTIDEAELLVVDDVMGLDAIAPRAASLAGKRCLWVAAAAADVGALEARLHRTFGAGEVAVLDVGAMAYRPPNGA